MTNFRIVTLPPEEWQPYKQLRLEALLQEPQSFSTRYEEMLQKPDTFWQGRLVDAQSGETSRLLFARENDASGLLGRGLLGRGLIGMIGAYCQEGSHTVDIISVYVTREKRRQGVAHALMTAILAEVEQQGRFSKALLSVTVGQDAAIALYQRFGFQIVGENTGVMGDGLTHTEYIMEKLLEPKASLDKPGL